MYTYDDLQAAGADEQARIAFVDSAIHEYRSSGRYDRAIDGELYYNGENPTIMRYEKIIYDALGKAHKDMWTANHKIASNFFGFAVDQLTSYLLGNGITFDGETKMTDDFDQDVAEASRCAQWGGVAYGFPELQKHTEGEPERFKLRVFSAKEFVPLYSEENGALMAGIRFWQIAPDKPLRATLYEADGYTDYLQPDKGPMQILKAKRAYNTVTSTSVMDGTEIFEGWNYPGFPIVPLMNNKDRKSSLVGRRNTIDALDLADSNMVNNVDEGNLIYWVLKNYGGMDPVDDAKFLSEIVTTHILHIEGDDASADPHTVEAPWQSTQATIDRLTKKLYEDFQAFDASAVSAGNQTATAIKASYVPLDLKADKFEEQVTRFLLELMRLTGVDARPSYTRNKIVNAGEEMQNLLMGAQYFDDEYTTRKLLALLGDADQYEEMMARKDAEALDRISALEQTTQPTEPTAQPNEPAPDPTQPQE